MSGPSDRSIAGSEYREPHEVTNGHICKCAAGCDRCQHSPCCGSLACMSAVNADRQGGKPYHHGALHSALVEASIALAREGGPDRVILREAARAAGVSHSAAYRHFTDRGALLAEVSRHARKELAAQMRRRVNRAKDPPTRLQAVG